MLEKVKQRLETIGCSTKDEEEWAINFIMQKVESEVRTECNLSDIPEGLENVVIDMVVGEFLLNKKSTGSLEGINIDAAVKQIKEGDTSITYAIGDGDGTPEKRLDIFINYLISHGRSSFASYRRLKW